MTASLLPLFRQRASGSTLAMPTDGVHVCRRRVWRLARSGKGARRVPAPAVGRPGPRGRGDVARRLRE